MAGIMIPIDRDVPMPDGPERVSPWSTYTSMLLSMNAGDSFFMARGTRHDVLPMIRYAKKLDVELVAHEVEEDELYLLAGVRVWRVGPIQGDLLKSEAPSPQAAPPQVEEPTPVVTPQDTNAQAIPATSKFWRRPDGSCTRFRAKPNGPQLMMMHAQDCEPISEAEYKKWENAQEL